MMYSTRAFHMFSRFPTRALAMLFLPAVLVFMALGCGGGEPASPGGDTTPQATAESRPREREPGSSSAGATTPQSTSQAASQQPATGSGASTPGAATPQPASVGQSGSTPGQTGQPTSTAASGGQSGTPPGQTEVPAPTATPAPTPTPVPPPCDRQRAETDRAALEVLFNATNGESWDDSGIWLGPAPISQWPGVQADDGGCVTGLRLWLGGLHGELPPELGNLTNLQALHITGGFDGEIPPELGNLTNLRELYLNGEFDGEIPAELGNLANLQTLTLRSGNQFSGEMIATPPPGQRRDGGGNWLRGDIPPELGNLTNLLQLDLFGNQFSGEIPAELGKLTNLQTLSLGGNQLSGDIPPELGNLANLQTLSLAGNQFSGEIPPELGHLASLRTLYLTGNQFSGEIPAELENLVIDMMVVESAIPDDEYRYGSFFLERARASVSIDWSQLSGCLSDFLRERFGGNRCDPPAHAGDTEALAALYDAFSSHDQPEHWLTRNAPVADWEGVSVDRDGRVISLMLDYDRNVGYLPPELGNLTSLRVLSLVVRYNFPDRSLEIPPELGNLTNLQVLDLTGEYTGKIPSELGNLANLQVLYLAGELDGEIPPELGNLANLQALYLAGVKGEMPTELANLTNLQYLSLLDTDNRSLYHSGVCIPGSPPPFLGEGDHYFCGE